MSESFSYYLWESIKKYRENKNAASLFYFFIYYNKMIISVIKELFLDHFLLIWFMISMLTSGIILSTSNQILIWPPSFTADGLSLFVKVFSIPIYFAASGIPIQAIILTIRRLEQSDKQYRSLLFNNYKPHFDDFKETMLASCDEEICYLLQPDTREKVTFIRNIHTICFGHRFQFDYQLKNNSLKVLSSIAKLSRKTSIHITETKDILSVFSEIGIDGKIDLAKFDKLYITSLLKDAFKIAIFVSDFAGTQLEFNNQFYITINKIEGFNQDEITKVINNWTK